MTRQPGESSMSTGPKALEAQVLTNGLVSAEEIRSGRARSAPVPVRRVLHAGKVAAGLRRGGPADRPAEGPARFGVGDAVATRTMNPPGHTRLPRYALRAQLTAAVLEVS